MKDSFRIAMLRAFEQTRKPRGFLTGLARCPAENITKAKKLRIDIVKNNQSIAVDVIPGTQGRANNSGKYATNDYTPPAYDEYGFLSAEDLNKVDSGDTEYIERNYTQEALKRMNKKQVEYGYKVTRAIEKQAADALFTGQVVLVDGTVIDYKRDSDHTFTAASAWGVNDDPMLDLEQAVYVNRRDALVTSDYTILGRVALTRFLANKKIIDSLDKKNLTRGDINWPSEQKDGAIFHGRISTAEMTLDIFSYPEQYTMPSASELPDGASVANAGQTSPYVPEDMVYVGSTQARFDLMFAGVPVMNKSSQQFKQMTGFSQQPRIVKGSLVPYALVDTYGEQIKVGIKSRPLWVPTQVDAGSAFQLK